MRIPVLANNPGRLARAAVNWVTEVAGVSGRAVWARPGRCHIEARGVRGPDGGRVARRIEHAVERHPGVEWARVNGPSGRVVIALNGAAPSKTELVTLVARAESGVLADGEAGDEPDHPSAGPRTGRAVVGFLADAVGLTVSTATKVLSWAPIPTDLAALASVVEHHPRLRELAERGLGGPEQAASVLPIVSALSQGLAGGGAGIVLDALQRLEQWREARAHRATWEKAEPDLVRSAEDAVAEPMQGRRPRPVPDGPVERYAKTIMSLGAVGAAVATPFVGPRRALAVGLASLPKAPRAGREGFAAHLGRVLAKRGVIVMDRNVLRELDRLDTLVLDETALRAAHATLTEVLPLAGADSEEVASLAYGLFDPDEPSSVRSANGWTLAPVSVLELRGRRGAREQGRLRRGGADVVLGLARGTRLEAVAAAAAEPTPGMAGVVAAARRAGLRVVLATDQDHRRPTVVDEVVPGGDRLAGSIRAMQADGAAVLLLSGDRRALAAADCALGMYQPGAAPAWGAHLLIGYDLEAAAWIVQAVGVSHAVDRASIMLAKAGSAVGAVASLRKDTRRAASSSLLPVNTAAAAAFAYGLWHAHRVHSRPVTPPVRTTPWHMMPTDVVLATLEGRREGLRAEEVRHRSRHSGDGQAAGTGLLEAFFEELSNPLTPVLAAGAAVSAAVGSVIDAALVGVITSVSALVGSVQQVRTDRALTELFARSAVGARVRRDGAESLIPAGELVLGDVVVLEPGDVVPADCRVLDAYDVEADESSLTGESLPVTKGSAPIAAAEIADRRSMLYEGTTLAAGHALAIVVAIGEATEVGRSMATARQAPPVTGVESRLAELTRISLPLAIGSAAAVAGAGLLRGIPLRDTVSAAVNLAVASVPEGLPFLVNAAQLAAARRLAAHGALVRNPRTIEALGRADVLCFDKTGTLTQGRLRLVGVGDEHRDAALDELDRPLRMVLAAALRATPAPRSAEPLPHQTDRAVSEGAQAARIVVCTDAPGWRVAATLPFESSRGYHAAAGTTGDGGVLISMKGAPEVVMPRCRHHLVDGRVEDLTPEARARMAARVDQLAGAGQRVLAVAERRATTAKLDDNAVDDLTFLGFLTFADPVRASAAPAAARLRAAGVHIVMITGDHPATADAIAATVNPSRQQRVITGADVDELDDERLDKVLADVDVIARCSPTHKVRIIQAYQRCGRVVAMTGDGANDAPAIRLADVGIALGHRGTPAARAAADLVVTDDRLETIIAALVEGRAMWSSVREALAILLGGNLGEIGFSVLAAAVTGRSPLTARQLLLVNLLTDLAPALAIALRPPKPEATEGLLGQGPTTSLGEALTRDLAVRAATTGLGATAAWIAARLTGSPQRAGTVALAALVGTQLGQTLAAGGPHRGVLAASLGSAAALAAVIQTPGLSGFFGCRPLGPVGWGIATGSAAAATGLNAILTRWLA